MRSSSLAGRLLACALAAGAFWLLGARPAQAQSRDLEVRWAPWLHLDSVAAAKVALRRRHAEPLRMSYYGPPTPFPAAPLTVRTCAAYLLATDTSYAPASPSQFRIAEGYSQCPVLEFIAASAPAATGPPLVAVGGGFGWALPPLDCPGECGGQRARSYKLAISSGRPWAWWDPGLRVERRSGLVVYLQDAGWGYGVSLVAERIPPPPQPRVYAVVVATVARHGSYHGGAFAVLVREGGTLRVVRTPAYFSSLCESCGCGKAALYARSGRVRDALRDKTDSDPGRPRRTGAQGRWGYRKEPLGGLAVIAGAARLALGQQ